MSLLELALACGERLRVHRFSVRETVSSLFDVRVVVRSPDPLLNLKAIVGQPAALRIASGYRFARGGERLWSGHCYKARLVQAVDLGPDEVGLSTYEIRIAPLLWLLTQRSNWRVFQHQSAPDIVRAVLDGWRMSASWHVDPEEHPRLAYKVQIGETEFNFVSRLLEEAGIAYVFEDDGERSRLVLSDALHRTAPRREAAIDHVQSPSAGTEREYVTRISIDEHVRPGAVVLRDYDFQRPAFALLSDARCAEHEGDRRLEHYRYQPGALLIERGTTSAAPSANHDARHGALLAARALEAERASRCRVLLETNAIDLRPGVLFCIEDHPRPELDPRSGGLLVTSVSIDGSPDGDWTMRVKAVPAVAPYRPPLRIPKPRIHSVQSAVVVGPPGQEIHTDEHGRVRVQFPWDREGQRNERSSCWLRVSQGWSGPGFGMVALPRVGQEVLVAFLDGDPDQPIVVGRASNVLNPLPLKLPEQKTQSTWRSASSSGGERFNEIRFEDARGSEFLAVHAARDLRTRVEHDEALSVGRDRTKAVGGDETARTEGRVVIYVGKDAHLTVEGELRERIAGTRSLTVERSFHQQVGSLVALEAGDEIHLRTRKLELEADDVTLRGAGGFIHIGAGGVEIDGGTVKIKEGGMPGAGQGAHPKLPVVPEGVQLRAEPQQLPFLGFPGLPPMQVPAGAGRGGGDDGPLSPDDLAICEFICLCDRDPSPHKRPSDCLTARLRAVDAASGGTSRLKAEVPYDMRPKPPAPIMSRHEPGRPTTSKPKGSMVPDVVVVKDPSKPPTQDNLKEVVEVKFPGDRFRPGQKKAYQDIAGKKAIFRELTPEQCGCSGQQQEPKPEVTTEDVVIAGALVVAILWMIANDASGAGAADDVLIPVAVRELLMRMAPLLPQLGF